MKIRSKDMCVCVCVWLSGMSRRSFVVEEMKAGNGVPVWEHADEP